MPDLLGVLEFAELHVGASQPEQRQIRDDAVRVSLEKPVEHGDGLIVATGVVEILPLREHGLLNVGRNIILLMRRASKNGGGRGGRARR